MNLDHIQEQIKSAKWAIEYHRDQLERTKSLLEALEFAVTIDAIPLEKKG